MKLTRYCIGGGISLILHSLAISAQPRPMELTISHSQPLAAHSHVSIQFVASPKPEKTVQSTAKAQDQEPPPAKPKTQTPTKVKEAPTNPKPVVKKIKTTSNKAQPKDVPILAVEKKSPAPTTKAPIKKEQPQKHANAMQNALPKLVENPQFKLQPTPINYPRLAKRKGMQGTVLIELWLDEKGEQRKKLLIQGSGFELLDNAALTAIAQWRFQAYVENGVAKAHRVRIPVRFNLD